MRILRPDADRWPPAVPRAREADIWNKNSEQYENGVMLSGTRTKRAGKNTSRATMRSSRGHLSGHQGHRKVSGWLFCIPMTQPYDTLLAWPAKFHASRISCTSMPCMPRRPLNELIDVGSAEHPGLPFLLRLVHDFYPVLADASLLQCLDNGVLLRPLHHHFHDRVLRTATLKPIHTSTACARLP